MNKNMRKFFFLFLFIDILLQHPILQQTNNPTIKYSHTTFPHREVLERKNPGHASN